MSRHVPRIIFGALAILLALAPTSLASAVEVGARAPEIGMRDLDGRMVSLSSYRGKVVIVDVWASWCTPCEEEMPTLQRLHARYRRHGLRVVGVSVDRDETAARRFIENTNVRFRNVHDPDRRTPGRYGLATMPTSWIIDHRGIVRHVTAGFRARDAAEMERVVRRLLDALPSGRTGGDTEEAEADAPSDPAGESEEAVDDDVESGEAESTDTDEADPAAPADEPPAASRSEAGRSGGLCSTGGTASHYPEALLLGVGVIALLRRRRTARR